MADYTKGQDFALTYEQRQAVRERFKTLARTAENYRMVAAELRAAKLRVSPRTIAKYVRGR